MFRKYYQANDDTGEAVVVPDPPQFTDAADLIVNRINEVNAAADAAEGGEDTSDAPIGDGGIEGGDDAAERQAQEDLILGRFRTPDDVITAYQNLEPQYTQTRQQLRDMERQLEELTQQLSYQQQPERDFQFDAPFSNQPRNVQELEALAEQYPERAAMFAIENSENLPAELVQEVLNYWHQRNPAQATAYMVQQVFNQYAPQVENRLAPHDQTMQQNIVQSAVNMAEQQIGPQYGEYHNRIIDVIEQNPAFLPADTNDPQAMSQAIVNVYAMLVGQDTLARGKQLADQGTPPPAPNQARTQTRTVAAPPASASASEEDIEAARQIQNLILNAQG